MTWFPFDEKFYEEQVTSRLTTREVTEMMDKAMGDVAEMAEQPKYYTPEEIQENIKRGEQRKKDEQMVRRSSTEGGGVIHNKPTMAAYKDVRNKEKHLNHPFYKRVKEVVDEVEREQILKGSEKYPEPFNPESWTGKELVRHGLQEARDLQVYLVGLLDHVERIEEELKDRNLQYVELIDEHRRVEELLSKSSDERDALFFGNEHLTSENRKAAELFNNEVNKYCTLEKDYDALDEKYMETLEHNEQLKKLHDEMLSKNKEMGHSISETCIIMADKIGALTEENAEVKKDLEQHKKALVDLAFAFSGPFEKMKAENEQLKIEIEKFNNQKKTVSFDTNFEISGNQEQAKEYLKKTIEHGLKNAENHI